MIKYFCDRCGCEINDEDRIFVDLIPRLNTKTKYEKNYIVCPNCSEHLMDLEGEENESDEARE